MHFVLFQNKGMSVCGHYFFFHQNHLLKQSLSTLAHILFRLPLADLNFSTIACYVCYLCLVQSMPEMRNVCPLEGDILTANIIKREQIGMCAMHTYSRMFVFILMQVRLGKEP